jgi:predicted dehydrogenase
MPELRVALVGCGIISCNHLHAYQAHPDRARVVACCDLDSKRAQELAEEAGGARALTRFEDILADPSIDSVDLLTPHHLHCDQAVRAMRAGKKVLLQKPLAHTLEDAETILRVQRETGAVLYYGETSHTSLAAVLARRAIEEGRIGRLVGTQSSYSNWQGGEYLETSWRYDEGLSGGGQLFDGGIHAIATMVTVAGKIESVEAQTAVFRQDLGGEDTAVVNVRYENGALGTLFSSHASGMWFPGPRFVAYGTEGLLAIGGSAPLTLHRKDLSDRHETLLGDYTDGFAEMVGLYLDHGVDGAPNASPAEMGLHEMKVVLSAYRSSESGVRIKVD